MSILESESVYIVELLLVFTTNKYLHLKNSNKIFLKYKRKIKAIDLVSSYYSVLRSRHVPKHPTGKFKAPKMHIYDDI